jgi:hypothetical protein
MLRLSRLERERNGPGESPPLPRRRGRFVLLESRVGIRGPALNDEEHIITYLRLLDADAEGADWRHVARIVLHLDPEHEPDRARPAFDSHLSRAKWMTEHGYRHLLRGGASA